MYTYIYFLYGAYRPQFVAHEQIRNMEHMIEHETLPLKEEKQLIREIKQLKQHREQISSNMGNQDEVQKALDQKDQVEERLKVLFMLAHALYLSKSCVTSIRIKKKKLVQNNRLLAVVVLSKS